MSEKVFPAVPARVEPQTRAFLSFVRERLVRLLGGELDRAVTLRDLVELGLVDEAKARRIAKK